ncbi:MAG: radical SAM family heme chaperone HemW [Pseudomonadota bacterium]
MSEPSGLYIHVPFCIRKCPYCDFFSTTDLSAVPGYIHALDREISLRAMPGFAVDTLYLGGGTPSLLSPGDLARILARVRDSFALAPHAEITLEANPGTVRPDYFRDIRSLGFNRINIGTQSFNDTKLGFLGRIHTAADAARVLDSARQAGFDNIGLDLMYAVPGEDRAGWLADMDRALAFGPAHLSCYMLTYEPGTRMHHRVEQGMVIPMDSDACGDMFVFTSEYLVTRGYSHYEISNFAVSEAYRSRHNQKYWNRISYLGMGPSAHSFFLEKRSWNYPDVGTYCTKLDGASLPVQEEESLTRQQQAIELVMLGLRTCEGIDIKAFDQIFKKGFHHLFGGLVQDLKHQGLARSTREGLALTPVGMAVLDSVVQRFAQGIVMHF